MSLGACACPPGPGALARLFRGLGNLGLTDEEIDAKLAKQYPDSGGWTPPSGGGGGGGGGGSDWLTELIKGGAQVGAAAVSGSNPYLPQKSGHSAAGGISTSTIMLAGGGALLLFLLLSRRGSS